MNKIIEKLDVQTLGDLTEVFMAIKKGEKAILALYLAKMIIYSRDAELLKAVKKEILKKHIDVRKEKEESYQHNMGFNWGLEEAVVVINSFKEDK